MMKKFSVLVLLVSMVLLSGCNLFEKLDKKSDSRDVQEFEITEKMNSGDYSGVVSLVTDIINSDPQLKAIDNETDVAAYLAANYTSPVVQDYIGLKTTEAEARLGLANVKLSDILSKIVALGDGSSNQVSANIQGSTSGSTEIKIKDIIPDNINETELAKALEAYLKALPISADAYKALENEFGTDYLSGAIALTIGTVNSAIELVQADGSTLDNLQPKPWSEFNGSSQQTIWNANVDTYRAQLQAALDILILYAQNSSAVSEEDINKVKADAQAIKDKMVPFANSTEYNDFLAAVGLN